MTGGSPTTARLGVVLCTYNGERFLSAQLASILAQTRLPDVMIVGDDGSDDGTITVLERFCASAPFPTFVRHNPHRLGFADNFLSTAVECDAEILAFCDQDDVWQTHKLERMLRCFDDPMVTVAIHDAEVVDTGLTPLGWHHPNFRHSRVREIGAIDPWYGPPGFAMLVRRSLISAVDFTNRPQDHMAEPGHAKPHDGWLYLVGGAVGRVALVSDTLALYRQHSRSIAGSIKLSVRDHVRRSGAVSSGEYRDRAALAREYADDLVRRARDVVEPAWPDRLVAASVRWSRVAERLDQRAAVHDVSLPLIERAAAFADVAVHGGYRSAWRGGLGPRSCGKDLISLVSGRTPMMRRRPPRADGSTRR
jgi:glycosyltransferase involved in cell wall biosynthesis